MSYLEPVHVTRIPALVLPRILLNEQVARIGRDSFGPDSDHHVLGWVSASHCILSKKDDNTVWLEQHVDCKNGVFLNNSPNALGAGQNVELEEGDNIHLVKVFVPQWIEPVYVFRNGKAPSAPGPSVRRGRRSITNDAALDDKHLECAACQEPMVAPVTIWWGPYGGAPAAYGGAPAATRSTCAASPPAGTCRRWTLGGSSAPRAAAPRRR